MTDQSHPRQSSPSTAIHKVANWPHRSADHISIAGRRGFLVLLASGVAINAWALFPSTHDSGIYIPLPEKSAPSAADVKSAWDLVTRDRIELSRADAFRLMDAKLESSKPTTYGLAMVRYSSPAPNVSLVPLRAKLQALLMLLYSQYGDVDAAFVEAKLQALLRLPDSVLAQLIEHPDLADLNETLDAVFLGTSDLSGVRTELDKIDVTSVPGPSEEIDVVKVNGKPAYIVHSPAVQMRTENVAGSPVSPVSAPPSGPVTVVSLVGAPASVIASAFTMAPSSVQLPPPPPPPPAPAAPAAVSALAFTVAPSTEQFTPPPPPPPPVPAALSAPAFTVAPSTEQFTPPPPVPAALSAPAFTVAPSSVEFTPPPPPPTSTPTATTPTASVEPTGTAQTSLDDLNSGTTAGGSTTNNGGSTTNNGGSTTDGGSTTNNGGSTTNNGGSSTNKGGSTTNNGGSTTDGGSTTNNGGSTTNNGGSTTNKGGSTTNKGGHTGDTNDGAKKDADKGEK